MLKVFPQDLAKPIDASYLRMIVRRIRSNANKKRKATGGDSPEAKAGTAEAGASAKKRKLEAKLAEMDDSAPPPMLEVRVPGKGVAFPVIDFVAKDFKAK